MFDHVNLFSVTLRLALSLVMGGLLGMEREQKQRRRVFAPTCWFVWVRRW